MVGALSPRCSVPVRAADDPGTLVLLRCKPVDVPVEGTVSVRTAFNAKICSNDVFAITRLFAEADRNGKESECVTAVGGVSSV